jgi:hypothetical protein
MCKGQRQQEATQPMWSTVDTQKWELLLECCAPLRFLVPKALYLPTRAAFAPNAQPFRPGLSLGKRLGSRCYMIFASLQQFTYYLQKTKWGNLVVISLRNKICITDTGTKGLYLSKPCVAKGVASPWSVLANTQPWAKSWADSSNSELSCKVTATASQVDVTEDKER